MRSIALLLLTSCHWVVGVEDRPYDPRPEGCTVAAASPDALSIRVANLFSGEGSVDVCVRESGGDYHRPLFRGGGRSCPEGIARGQVSVPLAVRAATIDVKLVAAGARCDAAGSETRGVTVSAGHIATVVRSGNVAKGPRLDVFIETSGAPSVTRLRLIHAAPSSPALTFGFATNARPPSKLTSRLIDRAIPYGSSTLRTDRALTPNMSIDGDGYLVMPSVDYVFGAAPEGSSAASVVATIARRAISRTLYVTGEPTDPAFPLRALVCDDGGGDGLLARCSNSPLPTIAVDVFNANLYGAFAFEEDSRRPFVIDGIAARPSDLACIVEVTSGADGDAIVEKARARGYAYAYAPKTTLETPPFDARDESGTLPPPSTAACGAKVDRAVVDEGYKCLQANCADASDKLSGGAACLSAACAGPLVTLFAGTRDDQACLSCIVVHGIAYETWTSGKKACQTDPRPQYGFGGQIPSLILSRFPIVESELAVLPATSFRRAVLRTRIEIEPAKTIDFYCLQLAPALGGILPYSGPYSASGDADGWAAEHQLQAIRAVAWIREKSGKRPAIIAADVNASPDFPGLTPRNANVFGILSAFTEALAPKWVPRCTRCKSNLFGTITADEWTLHHYLLNFAAGATVDAEIFYDDPRVTLPDGRKVPFSDTHGYSVQILRPD